jgi:hypothetical protein
VRKVTIKLIPRSKQAVPQLEAGRNQGGTDSVTGHIDHGSATNPPMTNSSAKSNTAL